MPTRRPLRARRAHVVRRPRRRHEPMRSPAYLVGRYRALLRPDGWRRVGAVLVAHIEARLRS